MTLTVSASEVPGQGLSPPTERVIAVLEFLGRSPATWFTLAEICRDLGISRGTGHAILTTLAAREWAVRDPQTARYMWGPAIAALGRSNPALLHRADLQALSAATGTQVSLARQDGQTLLVVDTVGDCPSGPRIQPGMRTPFVAPIGRDYAAWSNSEVQRAWLAAIGTPSPEFRQRMTLVLNEIRQRGFVVERLSPQYVRVYTALRALSADGEVDQITTGLARAYADLTAIDILDEELAGDTVHSIATVSAPIREADGTVRMVVMAAVFAELDGAAIRELGERVRRTANNIGQRIARYGGPG